MTDITIGHGLTTRLDMAIADPSTGSLLDLASNAVILTAKYSASDVQPLFTLTQANGGIVALEDTTYNAQLVFAPECTEGLPNADHMLFYDLLLTTNGETDYPAVASGRLIVRATVGAA
jgi:hypothetical protein